MRVVYIAGPYRGQTHDWKSYFEIDRNITNALEAAARLAQAGVGYFCPHKHSEHMEVITPTVPPEYWIELDIEILSACDAILMLPRWTTSSGATAECDWAKAHGIPVFYLVEDVIDWARIVN